MLSAFFIIFLLFACGLAGYYLFTGVFDLIFGKPEKQDNPTYIDKSVHYHHHQHLHIDNDETTITIDD